VTIYLHPVVNWHTIWTSIATPAAVAVLVALVTGYSLTTRLAVRQQRFLAVDSVQRELVSHLATDYCWSSSLSQSRASAACRVAAC
jgi:hypothetical protein